MNNVEPHAAPAPGSASQSEMTDQTPGALLRAAREARGLALNQAARRLRTKSAVLQALENNQFKALGAPVFVRMYLVRYAELLGLPEHEVLGRYKQLGIDQPPPLRLSHSTQSRARAGDLRWLSYPAGFALVAWLGWTITQQQPDWTEGNDTGSSGRELARMETPRADAPRTDAPAAESSVAESSVAATETALPSDPLSPDTVPATPASLTDPDARADETVALAALESGTETAASVAGTLSDAARGDEAIVAAADSSGERMPQPIGSALAGELDSDELPPGSDQVRLVLEFQGECWVEIEDSSGRRLVYGLLNADESRSLTGETPFSIKLGNARAVQRISLNGEAIDPSLYLPERGSVSRFTLTTPPRG